MDMQHGHGHAAWKWACTMDMGKQHGHGHGAWTKTWASSMHIDTQHGHGHEAWTCTTDIEMDKHHGCRNADEKFSPASLVFRQFSTLIPASWSVR
jgi:hypothetical protein